MSSKCAKCARAQFPPTIHLSPTASFLGEEPWNYKSLQKSTIILQAAVHADEEPTNTLTIVHPVRSQGTTTGNSFSEDINEYWRN